MSTDFTKPVVGDGYAVLIPGVNQAIVDLGKMLEPTDSGTHTSIPTGTRRWNATTNRFEKYNGSSWVENSTLYAINISGNAGTVTNGLYSTGSYADPAWLTALAWSKLTGKPTTAGGYGITDAITTGNIGAQSVNYAASAGSASAVAWSGVSSKPTTVAGYGITDMSTQSVAAAANQAASYTAATTPLLGTGVSYSVAHGLAAAPAEVMLECTCLTADGGWAVGDVITPGVWNGTGQSTVTTWKSATNVGVIIPSGFVLCGSNKGGSSVFTLTAASWSYRFKMRLA